MKNEIIVDPHYLSGEKEKWHLKFNHSSCRDNCVDYNLPPDKREPMLIYISLEAVKYHEKPSLTQTVEVGKLRFPVDEKPESIRLTSHMDDSIVRNIVETLIKEGYAKQTGIRTERYQDYPGDEIESFHYARLDVTDYYNDYIREKEKQVDNSPISDIRLVEKYDDPYCLSQKPLDYLTCRIGGIEQDRQWVGTDGVDFRQTAELYPKSRYQLYELAAKAQSKQMQLYEDACKRVSDYSVYEARGVFRMRCKIDGVQQMSRQVDKEDVSTYLAYKDIFVLAAKYYKDVLTEGVNNTMSRTR